MGIFPNLKRKSCILRSWPFAKKPVTLELTIDTFPAVGYFIIVGVRAKALQRWPRKLVIKMARQVMPQCVTAARFNLSRLAGAQRLLCLPCRARRHHFQQLSRRETLC